MKRAVLNLMELRNSNNCDHKRLLKVMVAKRFNQRLPRKLKKWYKLYSNKHIFILDELSTFQLDISTSLKSMCDLISNTSGEILMSSDKWLDTMADSIVILDPDGWDRTNYDFSFNQELISYNEFNKRLSLSTFINR